MADYWVSRDKYFCKYCKIYIADDKPSRIHHETGFRHKGNYERYIREVYRKGMTDKKDRAEEAKELARVEAAAAAAMGLPPPDAPSSSSSTKAKATASASTSTAAPDPFANYSTAAQLGYRDEAAERAAVEAGERAEEAELRKSEGTIGQWQKVAKPVVGLPPAPAVGAAAGKGKGRAKEGFVGGALLGSAAAAAAVGGIKREDADVKPDLNVKPAPLAAGTDDVDDDSCAPATKKRRAFLAEKSAFPDDDDDDDDALSADARALAPIKLKKRRLTVKEQAAEAAAREAAEREVVEREGRRAARDKEGATVGQWESVEVGRDDEQAPLEFEAPVVEEARGGEVGAGAKEEKEEDKPKAAPSGFKKRKMPGAAARRK
ncbi:hypothetical protein JCM8208_005014 [Rhodotorula glutinis]